MVDGKEGGELYFITSGHTINSPTESDSFYGAFQVRWNEGQLLEYGDARRPSGADPVTPERVLFEALSGDVWGWVVKTRETENVDGFELTAVRNVVLAPRKGQIAVLAEFYGTFNVVGAGNCEETERIHANWKLAQSQPKTAQAAGGEGAMSPEEQADDNIEPPRCTNLQWSYRTDPVIDSTFTPLYITRKPGLHNGENVAAKTWKVMFDPKSFTYLLPKELKDVSV